MSEVAMHGLAQDSVYKRIQVVEIEGAFWSWQVSKSTAHIYKNLSFLSDLTKAS